MFYHIETEERSAGGRGGTVYTLSRPDVGSLIEVWPAHGFNCLRWRAGGHDLLFAAPDWAANPVPTASRSTRRFMEASPTIMARNPGTARAPQRTAQNKLRSVSRKPRAKTGTPIGAPTIVNESTMPTIIRTRPSTTPNTRPVRRSTPASNRHSPTKGHKGQGIGRPAAVSMAATMLQL